MDKKIGGSAVRVLAVVLLVSGSVVSCASAPAADQPIELVRARNAGVLPPYSESGFIDTSTGCAKLLRDDGFERSLIFLDSVPIVITPQSILYDDKLMGSTGKDGVRVTLKMTDGPLSTKDPNISGPTSDWCNQTEPSYVATIEFDN